jgi:hypothetical protein
MEITNVVKNILNLKGRYFIEKRTSEEQEDFYKKSLNAYSFNILDEVKNRTINTHKIIDESGNTLTFVSNNGSQYSFNMEFDNTNLDGIKQLLSVNINVKVFLDLDGQLKYVEYILLHRGKTNKSNVNISFNYDDEGYKVFCEFNEILKIKNDEYSCFDYINVMVAALFNHISSQEDKIDLNDVLSNGLPKSFIDSIEIEKMLKI